MAGAVVRASMPVAMRMSRSSLRWHRQTLE